MKKFIFFILCFFLFFLLNITELQAKKKKGLGPRPPKCAIQGCYGTDIGAEVKDNAWNGELTVSPWLVKVGQTITVTGVPISPDTKVTIATFPGKPIGGPCVGHTTFSGYTGPAGETVTCVFKAVSPTDGWGEVIAYFSGFVGTGVEEEAYAVVSKKGPYYISGTIKSIPFAERTEGEPIQNMEVFLYKVSKKRFHKSGKGNKGRRHRKRRRGKAFFPQALRIKKVASTKTGADGSYFFKVKKKGSYRVIPLLRDSDLALKEVPDLQPVERKVKVVKKKVSEANFILTRGQSLDLKIINSAGQEIHSVLADGLQRGQIVAKLKGPNDEPRYRKTISFHFASMGTGGGAPALVCGTSRDSFARVWPSKGLNGFAQYGHLSQNNLVTRQGEGGDAEARADVLFGNQPGTFTVYAEVEGDTSTLTSYDVALTQPVSTNSAFTSTELANTIFNAITTRTALGRLNLDPNAPFTFQNRPSSDPKRAVSQMMQFFSNIRTFTNGFEYAPVKGLTNSGSAVYAVVAYPTGAVVRQEDSTASFPQESLVFADATLGLSELLDIPDGNPNNSYTVHQLSTINQWRALNGVTELFIYDWSAGTALYGGAPYKVNYFSQSGAGNCLAGLR